MAGTSHGRRASWPVRAAAGALMGSAIALGGGCTHNEDPVVQQALAAGPSDSTVIRTAGASTMSVRASRAVWGSSPVVVTVAADGPVTQATETAVRLGVPVIVLPEGEASAGESASARLDRVRAELARLAATHVLHVGPGAPSFDGVAVASSSGDLPEVVPAQPVAGLVAVTVEGKAPPGAAAALATLESAGARHVTLSRGDPRVQPADVAAIADAEPTVVVGVGTRFGERHVFAQRIEAAATGVQLPGGGQTIFDGKRYVALYGHPRTASLGVLGEQGPKASVRRARSVAAQYEGLTRDTIVPAFEVIATVATGGAGDDGDYSAEWDVEELRPLVDAAAEAGLYVLLDLQSGRADFRSQATLYQELLREPHVGLALDPEWRLARGEKPLEQIGSVTAAEINRTTAWLARFTDRNDLPQKMVLLHQFTPSMITDRQDLELGHDELALIVQMDGDGTLGQKLGTWSALRSGAPPALRFGWKNFFDEDEPMPSPATTFRVRPTPWWVSYQ